MLTLGSGGSGYDPLNPPQVMLSAPPAGGVQAMATAVVNSLGAVTRFTITNPGSGYLTAPTAMIAAPRAAHTAMAAVLLTSAGLGYTSPPTITIAPPQITATAQATLNTTAPSPLNPVINVTNMGAGYIPGSTPIVTFQGGSPMTPAIGIGVNSSGQIRGSPSRASCPSPSRMAARATTRLVRRR